MNERTKEIVEDGETLRVPLMLMDSVQRAIATNSNQLTKADPRAEYINQITNDWKSHENALATDAERKPAAPSDAYLSYVRRTTDAWKGA